MKIKGSPEFGDIENIKKFLEFFLTDAFVEREYNKARTLSGKKNYSFLIPVEIHPAVQLFDCINYLIRENPPGMPTNFTRHFTDLMMLSLTANGVLNMCDGDLNKLWPKGYIRKVKDRILDKRGFYHVMYELQMASFLSLSGKKVELQDVGDKEWPDLHASDGNGQYYVECKRLGGPSMLLEQTCVEVFKLIGNSHKNSRIDIMPKRLPQSMEEVCQIVKRIKEMTKSNLQEIDTDDLCVRLASLPSTNEGEIFLPADRLDHDLVTILGEPVALGAGKARFKSPLAFTIKAKEIALPNKAIETELKKGYSQIKNIPENETGIICIDISPYITTRMLMKDTEFLQVEAQAKATIKKIFAGPHFKRLGGVILTYNIKRLITGDMVQVAMNGSQFVHEKASLKMPKDFLTKKNLTGTDLVFLKRDANLFISQGIQAANEGRLEQSVAFFDGVTLYFPELIEGWINKALSLRKLKRYDEAIDVLRKGLMFHSNHKQLMTDLAQCHADAGDSASGSKVLDDIKRIYPS